MANKKLFQIWDNVAANVAGPIMAFNREGPAIREFYQLLSTGDKTTIGANPKDYDLVMIGEQREDDDDDGHQAGTLISRKLEVVARGGDWILENERRKTFEKQTVGHINPALDILPDPKARG